MSPEEIRLECVKQATVLVKGVPNRSSETIVLEIARQFEQYVVNSSDDGSNEVSVDLDKTPPKRRRK